MQCFFFIRRDHLYATRDALTGNQLVFTCFILFILLDLFILSVEGVLIELGLEFTRFIVLMKLIQN